MAREDLLIDAPTPIRTPRLTLRPPRAGDGEAVHAAKRESWPELHAWMIWTAIPLEKLTVADDEAYCRERHARFILREDITLLIFKREDGVFLGGCGLHDCDWKSRSFMIGFWIRTSETGRGYATEVATSLARYAFLALSASRVSVFHAEGNARSRRVIEKVGFEPEGVFRRRHRLPGGALVDERHYALLDEGKLPPLRVEWGEPEPG